MAIIGNVASPASKALEKIGIRQTGASHEADLFSVLHQSPYIIRSFEYALADGAIDCSREYPSEMSVSERFWDAYERRHPGPQSTASDLLLVDIKSTVGEDAGSQNYLTRVRQARRVGVYIGICARDPSWVEVIPNYSQDASALENDHGGDDSTEPEDRLFSANITCQSRLPATAYGGLGQNSNPYRMPLAMLPEAIRSIRDCVLGRGPYVNPWTRTRFDWTPFTTRAFEWLTPRAPDHAAPFQAVMDIYRFSALEKRSKLTPEFLWHQPTLGDFKLILDGSQYIIQHKLFDATKRREAKALSQLPLARKQGEITRFYFSAFDRFDFLWYQITLNDRNDERVAFFFLPEKILPDEFFSSPLEQGNFGRPEFRDFYFEMDRDCRWVLEVERVIREHPAPRKPTYRPVRAGTFSEEEDAAAAAPAKQPRGQASLSAKVNGPAQYAQASRYFTRMFFYGVMAVCAARKSGALVQLSRDHPFLDFGFIRYIWTDAEVEHFVTAARPPIFAHQLFSHTQLVPVCCFSRDSETHFTGPNVRPPDFRRMDSSSKFRLLVWDMEEPSSEGQFPERYLSPALIPSEDVEPTAVQRQIFRSNLGKAPEEWRTRTPSITALLKTGLFASEYAIGHGDVTTEVWSAVWSLLSDFSQADTTQHPPGFNRDCSLYRHSMAFVNQELAAYQKAHLCRDFSEPGPRLEYDTEG